MKDYTNPYQPPSSEPASEPNASSAPLSSRWKRLFGAIVDTLVQVAIVGPFLYFSGAWNEMIQNNGNLDLTDTIGWFIAGEVAFLAAQGYLLFNRQQTIGKWLLNMQITGIVDSKVPASKLFGIRYFLMHVLAQIPGANILLMADPLLIFRKDKRCLHDLLAGTQVVDIKPA